MTFADAAGSRKHRVLFIALRYDYGVPGRGYSFEYENFYTTLLHMDAVELELFPFDEIMRNRGRTAMNRELLEAVDRFRPEICFFFLFTDEIAERTIRDITDRGTIVTVNWFADDHWRFEEFSRYWAQLFHWVVTTDRDAPDKYRKIGQHNVIRSQWGFNQYVYTHRDVPYDYDVTFVGQVHSTREKYISRLHDSGINVKCWGKGWPNGRISQEEMIGLYSRSKINLNFTESSIAWNAKQIAKLALNRRADDSVRFRRPREISARLKLMFGTPRPQIKGRNFEIPGAGGFLLTQYTEGIEEYFVPGREIETFASPEEMGEKIRYYLTHDRERESIRRAGYERAQRDHTLQRRLDDIFRCVLTRAPAGKE